MSLHCPRDGTALAADTAHSLVSGSGRRWPVLDGIAFLRVGREALAAETLAHLDRGDREAALVALLADQDDWWRGPSATPDALRTLVRALDTVSLREAMALLGWGPVADYFAHRWSDPTFLAGLALVEAHWNRPSSAFELACGIGHHLRELSRRGVRVAGADVVFAKLFLARHLVVPDATLVCFDASHPWPVPDLRADLVTCHDAFYFLADKPAIAARLRAVAGDGTIAIGHVHHRDRPNHSAGEGMSIADLAALFPDAVVYDDAALTRALAAGAAPTPATGPELEAADAFSLVLTDVPNRRPRPLAGGLAVPPADAALRRNPLYRADGTLAFPSPRYEAEYAPLATYPGRASAIDRASPAHPAARLREFVDLPARW